LLHDKIGVNHIGIIDPEGVLRCQCRQDAAGITAEERDRFDIGLNPGTAAGIGAGNGQDRTVGSRFVAVEDQGVLFCSPCRIGICHNP